MRENHLLMAKCGKVLLDLSLVAMKEELMIYISVLPEAYC